MDHGFKRKDSRKGRSSFLIFFRHHIFSFIQYSVPVKKKKGFKIYKLGDYLVSKEHS